MKMIGVIPARYASTRFPGKPLEKIDGRPMIQWVIEGARQSRLVNEIIVATDDQRIAEAATVLGCQAVMTDSNLPSGSDRIFAAVKEMNIDVVVNIQGDEPLITGELIDSLAQAFINQPRLEMATLGHPLSDEELTSMNAVKVLLNQQNEAIYFSRLPIPYSRHSSKEVDASAVCLKHVGMYAYRKDFLATFCQTPPCAIEKAESLEQLRALFLGAKIKVIPVSEASLGVDTPEDLKKVEEFLRRKHGR